MFPSFGQAYHHQSADRSVERVLVSALAEYSVQLSLWSTMVEVRERAVAVEQSNDVICKSMLRHCCLKDAEKYEVSMARCKLCESTRTS